LRRTYAAFPSGVTAVCAIEDGVPVDMAASAFTPASLEPPLLSQLHSHDGEAAS
jgi:flavin reductase (DIM6/NTAB) family NADH-FMN oxidoreductase RutF